MRIGMIGAGSLSRAVARLVVQNGHEVMLSNSRHPRTLTSTMISIKRRIGSAEEAAGFGEVVLIAIPFCAVKDLPVAPFVGKIVMEANNHDPQRNDPRPDLDAGSATTSQILADHLKGARVVKAWSAILETDIERDARPRGAPNRRALPVAGDEAAAKRIVSDLIDALGFDPVDAGPLSEGWRFERARPAYCVALKIEALRIALDEAHALKGP